MYEGLNCLMITEDWNMQVIKSQQIILRKIGILVRVVHLGLIIIAPPISVFVLVDLDSCLAEREKEYDLQHCYIKWSRSRLLKYDFFYLEPILEREGKRKNTNMGSFLMMIMIISNMLNHVQTLRLSHCLLISLSWRLKNSQVLFIFRYFFRSLDYCE